MKAYVNNTWRKTSGNTYLSILSKCSVIDNCLILKTEKVSRSDSIASPEKGTI